MIPKIVKNQIQEDEDYCKSKQKADKDAQTSTFSRQGFELPGHSYFLPDDNGVGAWLDSKEMFIESSDLFFDLKGQIVIKNGEPISLQAMSIDSNYVFGDCLIEYPGVIQEYSKYIDPETHDTMIRHRDKLGSIHISRSVFIDLDTGRAITTMRRYSAKPGSVVGELDDYPRMFLQLLLSDKNHDPKTVWRALLNHLTQETDEFQKTGKGHDYSKLIAAMPKVAFIHDEVKGWRVENKETKERIPISELILYLQPVNLEVIRSLVG